MVITTENHIHEWLSFPVMRQNEKSGSVQCQMKLNHYLSSRKEVWICAKHFNCEWVTVKGGKCPNGPPTIFDVPKLCIKQTLSSPRATKTATAEARLLNQRMFEDKSDKINDFENICTNIEIRYNAFRAYRKGNDLTLSMTVDLGRKVVQFLHFKEVNSPFGFLHLVVAEKDGF